MRKFNLNFNFIIADIVSRWSIGILRNLRFIKIVKTNIVIRILRLLYRYGIIRLFKIKNDHVLVYFKYIHGKPVGKLCIVSKPGKRCYWTLNKLSQVCNLSNFSGFYIISSQKGLFTSNYCLLMGRVGGEVIMKVDI